MDMRFGTWNVKGLYRAGTPMTVSRELSRYGLDLMGVQEIKWEGSGTAPAREYTFFCGKGRFLQEPHSVTSQKTAFFLVTAVKASNLTMCILLLIWCHTPPSDLSQSHYI
jgi:hypothetical protein